MIFGYNRNIPNTFNNESILLSLEEYWLFFHISIVVIFYLKKKIQNLSFEAQNSPGHIEDFVGLAIDYLSSFKSALTLMDTRIYLLVTCIKLYSVLNKSMMNLKGSRKGSLSERNLICLFPTINQTFPFWRTLILFFWVLEKLWKMPPIFLQQQCIIPILWSFLSSISNTGLHTQ